MRSAPPRPQCLPPPRRNISGPRPVSNLGGDAATTCQLDRLGGIVSTVRKPRSPILAETIIPEVEKLLKLVSRYSGGVLISVRPTQGRGLFHCLDGPPFSLADQQQRKFDCIYLLRQWPYAVLQRRAERESLSRVSQIHARCLEDRCVRVLGLQIGFVQGLLAEHEKPL